MMTTREIQIIIVLLEMASEHYSRHGCNDFRLSDSFPDMTREEMSSLDRNYHEWNGDQEEHDPEGNNDLQDDFALMSYFAAKLDDILTGLHKEGG